MVLEDFMAPSNSMPVIAAYENLWSQSIASILSQMAGKTIAAENSVQTQTAESAEDQVGISFLIEGAIRGSQAFAVSRSSALILVQMFTGEPLDPGAEFGPDQADAFAEMFRQSAGKVAMDLTQLTGQE